MCSELNHTWTVVICQRQQYTEIQVMCEDYIFIIIFIRQGVRLFLLTEKQRIAELLLYLRFRGMDMR